MAPRVVDMSDGSNASIKKDENINDVFYAPEFTIKEIRDSVPAHCFQRNSWMSVYYILRDLAMVAAFGYAATWIEPLVSSASVQSSLGSTGAALLRAGLWANYFWWQGLAMVGCWVLAHEGGHQALSPHKAFNYTAGFLLHSALLVPFHSWRISHSNHHKHTASMEKDEVFVPRTKSQQGIILKSDMEDSHSESMLAESAEDAPLYVLYKLIVQQLGGWPAYLIVNASGREIDGWANHFDPKSPIFDKHQRQSIIISDIGLIATFAALFYWGSQTSFMTVFKYYIVPYLAVNHWLVMVTFLQHTHPRLPHYRKGEWNFQRGAAATVDRPFLGWMGRFFFHNIAHDHVAHHFFSTMPHYHATEATKHMKVALGEHYAYDDTPIFVSLYRSLTQCLYVDNEGDILFYRNRAGKAIRRAAAKGERRKDAVDSGFATSASGSSDEDFEGVKKSKSVDAQHSVAKAYGLRKRV